MERPHRRDQQDARGGSTRSAVPGFCSRPRARHGYVGPGGNVLGGTLDGSNDARPQLSRLAPPLRATFGETAAQSSPDDCDSLLGCNKRPPTPAAADRRDTAVKLECHAKLEPDSPPRP